MPTYRHQHKFTTLAFLKWQLLTKKPKILKFIHSALNNQAHKVHISSCVCFCIKFCFYLCKFAKATSMINALITFSSLLQIFYRIFAKKILNFICRMKRGRDCFFITLYRFCLTQKAARSMKFSLTKSYKFQIFYHAFYNSTFSHQKSKICRSF